MKNGQKLFRCLYVSILVCLFSPAAFASGLMAPQIQWTPGEVGAVILGKDVESALKRYDSHFLLFKTSDFIPSVQELFKEDSANKTPMAVVADFNGDGVADIALFGSSGKKQVILAAISMRDRYRIKEVARSELVAPVNSVYPPLVEGDAEYNDRPIYREHGLYQYLGIVPGRAHANDPDPHIKRFSTDALSLETFQSFTRLFYMDRGLFKEWPLER